MTDDQQLTLWLGATRYYMRNHDVSPEGFCDALIEVWPALCRAAQAHIMVDVEDAFARGHGYGKDATEFQRAHWPGHRAQWERVRALWGQS